MALRRTDLMVGDWVCYKDFLSIPIRVCGISKRVSFEHSLFWNEDSREYVRIERYSEADYDEITPIPLTPEILEKNGFKEYNGYGYAGNKGYCFKGFYINHDFFIKIANIDCKVNFIHELQHALRLCGIEKTIEL